jgi:hypothetical protein
MDMGMACSIHGEMSIALRILGEKPEGKRPVGRYGRIQENVIKTGLKEIGCEGVNWIQLWL